MHVSSYVCSLVRTGDDLNVSQYGVEGYSASGRVCINVGNAAQSYPRKVCSKSQHRCEEKRCPSCKKTGSEKPYVLPSERTCEEVQRKLIFFDFETDQTTESTL
ncbi:hypothetical protein TNCV_3028111 [Trichonephila clavipes]|nr:hypothetical protein TNCV_3028111 [Trichonephila clavipes]